MVTDDPRDEERPEDELHPEDPEGPDEEDDNLPPDEGIQCPHCGAEGGSCEHGILFWSRCNCDWSGELAEQSGTQYTDLARAIWLSIRNRGIDSLKAQSWTYPLSELVGDVTDRGLDNAADAECEWGTQLRDYWLEVAADCAGCLLFEWRFDGGFPGSADTFGVVIAENPQAAVDSIRACVAEDIAAVRRFAATGACGST